METLVTKNTCSDDVPCSIRLPDDIFCTVLKVQTAFQSGNIPYQITPIMRLVCKKWLALVPRVHELRFGTSTDLTLYLAKEGYFELLCWALRNGAPCDDDLVLAAVVRHVSSKGGREPKRLCEYGPTIKTLIYSHGLRGGLHTLDVSCASGCLDLLVWWSDPRRLPRLRPRSSIINDYNHGSIDPASTAAKHGHIMCMAWAIGYGFDNSKSALFKALKHGHYDVPFAMVHESFFDEPVSTIAQLVPLLHESTDLIGFDPLANADQWPARSRIRQIMDDMLAKMPKQLVKCFSYGYSVSAAIRYNRYKTLKWMREDLPFACEYPDLAVCSDIRDPWSYYEKLFRRVTITSNREMISYVLEDNPGWLTHIVSCALSHGNMELLDWLRSCGGFLPGLKSACSELRSIRDLLVLPLCSLKWICVYISQTKKTVLKIPSIDRCKWWSPEMPPSDVSDTLSWLFIKFKSYPSLHTTISANAIIFSTIPDLEWLIKEGCPLPHKALLIAMRSCDTSTLRWLLREGCAMAVRVAESKRILGSADPGSGIYTPALGGDMKAEAHAHGHRILVHAFFQVGTIEFARWLLEDIGLTELWKPEYAELAAESSHYPLLNWLLSQKCTTAAGAERWLYPVHEERILKLIPEEPEPEPEPGHHFSRAEMMLHHQLSFLKASLQDRVTTSQPAVEHTQ